MVKDQRWKGEGGKQIEKVELKLNGQAAFFTLFCWKKQQVTFLRGRKLEEWIGKMDLGSILAFLVMERICLDLGKCKYTEIWPKFGEKD